MAVTVDIKQARESVIRAISVKLVPFLIGSPGIGKSLLIQSIAEEFELKLIDFRVAQSEPTDFLGFPQINPETNKAEYVPFDTFPLETDSIPEGYKGWLLFFDEMTQGAPATQKALYKILLDRQVGLKRLHKNVAMVLAGNKSTDNAMTEELSTAIQSRIAPHLELEINVDHWLEWAAANDIDHRITSFIKFKPSNLHRFDPDHNDHTFACPRTWEFASRLIKKAPVIERNLLPDIAGTISEGMAIEFLGFTKIYKDLVTVDQIVKNPTNIPVPDEPSVLYALTGSISNHLSTANAEKLMIYLNRLPMEFQIICMRDMIKRKKNNDLLRLPACVDWLAAISPQIHD